MAKDRDPYLIREVKVILIALVLLLGWVGYVHFTGVPTG